MIGEGSSVGYDIPGLKDSMSCMEASGAAGVARALGLELVDLNRDGLPLMYFADIDPVSHNLCSDSLAASWSDDVKAVVAPALRHRIAANYAGLAAGVNSEKLIQMLLDEVPADKTYEQPKPESVAA